MDLSLLSSLHEIHYEEGDLKALASTPLYFNCGVQLLCTCGESLISTGAQQFYLHKMSELIFWGGSIMQLIEASDDFHARMLLYPKKVFLLQLSDVVARHNDLPATYLKRSNEIFRLFKKLSIEHYKSHRDLAFYADRLHVSTTYLSRIVKKTTGHTAHFLLSELICADAKKWLESTDTDVKEIADRYGFSDQSAFGKFFKKKTGFSPLAFRQRGNPLPVSFR